MWTVLELDYEDFQDLMIFMTSSAAQNLKIVDPLRTDY